MVPSKYLRLAIIALSLVIGYSLGNFYPLVGPLSTSSTPIQIVPPQTVKFDIPTYAPFIGSNQASINFIEFGDYQCPFCERFFRQTFTQIIQNYVDSGRVRFYFLDLVVLGPDSETLAMGAWCANEQGKYYDYLSYMYSHQGQENTGWATPPKVEALAANVTGLSSQQFNSCLNSQVYTTRIQQEKQLALGVGATGTPTILIGNDKIGYVEVVGAQPYSVFQGVIETQLQKVSA